MDTSNKMGFTVVKELWGMYRGKEIKSVCSL